MIEEREVYIKPWYKIVLRFSNEVKKYLFNGRSIGQALSAFKYYYRYNRRMKSHFEEELPWLTHYAYERLKTLVQPGMKVLEFGIGGSTLFFRGLGAEVFSIEHDKKWFQIVDSRLNSDEKVKLNLIEPENLNSEIELKYSSNHGLFSEGLTWKAYSFGAEKFEDNFFDIILIDGRARPECLRNSISKLKKGGILIFDNSDRESYHESMNEILGGWKKEVFSGVTVYDWAFNETTIFYHPDYLN